MLPCPGLQPTRTTWWQAISARNTLRRPCEETIVLCRGPARTEGCSRGSAAKPWLAASTDGGTSQRLQRQRTSQTMSCSRKLHFPSTVSSFARGAGTICSEHMLRLRWILLKTALPGLLRLHSQRPGLREDGGRDRGSRQHPLKGGGLATLGGPSGRPKCRESRRCQEAHCQKPETYTLGSSFTGYARGSEPSGLCRDAQQLSC